MSTDYGIDLAVGFEVRIADVDFLKKTVPEAWHLESRFDQKTGAKLSDARVVDEAEHSVWVFGEEYEDFTFLCSEIADSIDCEWRASNFDPDCTETVVVFEPRLERREGEAIAPHIDIGGALLVADIVNATGELERIESALKKLGIEVREAIVRLCWSGG